jgi:hypothetical protein
MEDLAGFGKATEKFFSLIESAVGTLYRPEAIRAEGRAIADAEAYKVVALARAEAEAKGIQTDSQQELAERAVARIRHQELLKQSNIDSIVEITADESETVM